MPFPGSLPWGGFAQAGYLARQGCPQAVTRLRSWPAHPKVWEAKSQGDGRTPDRHRRDQDRRDQDRWDQDRWDQLRWWSKRASSDRLDRTAIFESALGTASCLRGADPGVHQPNRVIIATGSPGR